MFFVCVAAALLAGWSIEVARMFARRVAKERQRLAGGGEQTVGVVSWPAVAVILPIKGLDEDTPENVGDLLLQDYPRFRLLFAVESAEDPGIPVLARVAGG